METVAEWDRAFRVWHYSVSYRQLLLRSLTEESPSRVDVLFSNVRFLHGATEWEQLEISVDPDFRAPGSPAFHDVPGKWFVLNGGAGYLHATHCQWHEDDGNAMTPSRFGPLKRTD
ncbi:hypothetical protein ACIQM4_05275 [Streptomyces sp. NPDC091272]|uniref:hypothetical protein n=1 Tax=Streptomyces sp. NPDC091272 TaxID=3365981 RepID=UPI0037FB3E95